MTQSLQGMPPLVGRIRFRLRTLSAGMTMTLLSGFWKATTTYVFSFRVRARFKWCFKSSSSNRFNVLLLPRAMNRSHLYRFPPAFLDCNTQDAPFGKSTLCARFDRNASHSLWNSSERFFRCMESFHSGGLINLARSPCHVGIGSKRVPLLQQKKRATRCTQVGLPLDKEDRRARVSGAETI